MKNWILRLPMVVLAACLISVGAWAADSFRVATFNLANYLDQAEGTRPAKPPEAKAKVRECIKATRAWPR